jgi:type IV pilus assembly protein PilM
MFSKRFIGIDVGSQDLKLVELQTSGDSVRVLAAERVLLPDDADLATKMAAVEDSVRSFLAARRRVPVVCSVPPQDVTEKIVDFPPTDPDVVDDLLKFEAETHIPLPIEAVHYNHVVVRADAQATSVVLAACPRNVLTALQNGLQNAGAKLHALATPCVALLNALAQATPPDVLAATSGMMLVDVGASHTQVVVTANGQPRLVRSMPIGSAGLTEAIREDWLLSPAEAETRKWQRGVALDEDVTPAVEAWLNRLSDELRRVIQGFRATTRTGNIERIVLTGGGALAPGLAHRLTDLIGVSTQLLPLEESIVSGISSLAAAGRESVGFATAIGLALSADNDELSVNLLPTERHQQGTRLIPRPLMLGAIAGAIAAVVMIAAGLRSLNVIAENELKTLQVEERNLKKDSSAQSSTTLEGKRAEALKTLAGDVEKNSRQWLDIMRNLSERLPPYVSIADMTMEKYRSVTLRGLANSNETVADSLRSLRLMPEFADVRLVYANETEIEGQPFVAFEVLCRLPVPEAKTTRTARRPSP